jgi:chorismate mutase
MLNNEYFHYIVVQSMEKTIDEVEAELKRATESRVRAMKAIFKFREEHGEQYFKRRRGRIRSEGELRRLAEACRLNWKLMEEVGLIRRDSNGEIVVNV